MADGALLRAEVPLEAESFSDTIVRRTIWGEANELERWQQVVLVKLCKIAWGLSTTTLTSKKHSTDLTRWSGYVWITFANEGHYGTLSCGRFNDKATVSLALDCLLLGQSSVITRQFRGYVWHVGARWAFNSVYMSRTYSGLWWQRTLHAITSVLFFLRIVLADLADLAGLFRQWICYGETFGEPSLQLKAISRGELCRGALTCCNMFCILHLLPGFWQAEKHWKAMESLDPKVQRKHDAVCLWRRQWERCQGQRVKLAEKRPPWPPENSRKKSKTFDAEGFAEGCLKMPKRYWQTLLPLRTHTHAHTHTPSLIWQTTNNPEPCNVCRFMMTDADVCRCQMKMYAAWWKDYGLRMSLQLDHGQTGQLHVLPPPAVGPPKRSQTYLHSLDMSGYFG